MTNLQKLRKAEKKLEQIEPSALTRLHLAAAAVKAAVEAYPQEQGTRHLSWWTRLTTSIPRTYSIDSLTCLKDYEDAGLNEWGPTIFADEYPLLFSYFNMKAAQTNIKQHYGELGYPHWWQTSWKPPPTAQATHTTTRRPVHVDMGERGISVDEIIDIDSEIQYQLAPANLRYAFETALYALNAALVKKGNIFINSTCVPSSIAYNTNNGVWQTMKNTVSRAFDFALKTWTS